MSRSHPLRAIASARLPLRARLTVWYLTTFTAILVIFLTFLYWQMQRTLLAQMDAGLQLAATQALVNLSAEEGRPAFRRTSGAAGELDRLLGDDFVVYLLDPDGAPLDWLGDRAEFPAPVPEEGLSTVSRENDQWRVYAEQLRSDLENDQSMPEGWLLVAQEIDAVSETLARLRAQMVLGLPLALLLAGMVGFLLAGQALRPIERITNTAQSINAGDLSRRIGYRGPADEIGRLAATFDRMLERLQGAFERERRFTADAAHELRTPLTALKGRLEVTLSRPRQAEAYRETLQEMAGQVERLIRLSNDLLFMARLEQGEQPRQRETVALEYLLALVMDQVQPLAGRKGIALQLDVSPGATVRGDLDLLIRLFLNLVDNAVKYTAGGGKVAVGAKPANGEVAITVSDTGQGIPEEHLPRLFDRFYRVEADRGRSPDAGAGGAGLGLAIAAEVARMHGGRIAVQSAVGEGTTFTVTLPRAAAPPQSQTGGFSA